MTGDTTPAGPEVVLHEQRLWVDTARVPVGRVVLRRRVTTQVRQVEVTVRQEELEVHYLPPTTTRPSPAGRRPPRHHW